MTDRFCPLGFLMVATFTSVLLWMCAVLKVVPLP